MRYLRVLLSRHVRLLALAALMLASASAALAQALDPVRIGLGPNDDATTLLRIVLA